MSACRGVFVLCNSRWRTCIVSGLRNIGVYAIQGCNKRIVNVYFLDLEIVSCLSRCLYFRESAFWGSTVAFVGMQAANRPSGSGSLRTH